jgi:uncharacterized delta-60 repeat protein
MQRHRSRPDQTHRYSAPQAFEPLEQRRLMSGGILDTTFSLDGKVTTTFDASSAFAADSAVQVDGKTVVVGSTIASGSSLTRFALARFNVDGSLDTTFGPDHSGKVITQIGSGNLDIASAVAIQPDGKIVVVGSAHRIGGNFKSQFAVARYTTDGLLDRSFAGTGKRTFRVKGDIGGAEDVALQRDGKIVIAGDDLNGGLFSTNFDFAVARLNPDGSLDSSFANGGSRIIGMGHDESAHAVAIDYSGTAATNPNFGKIVLAGERTGSGRNEYAMARLNANGSLDNSFDKDGQLVGKFRGYSKAFVGGLTIQPSGKYVIAGNAIDNTPTDDTPITLARYNANGALDTSFGAERIGFAYIDFGGKDLGDDVIQTADGGLVVAGTSNGRFALAKLSADGVLNTTFGSGGKVITDFGSDGTASHVGLARNAGTQLVVTGGDRFKTARYRENGGTVITVSSTDPESTEGTGNNAVFTVSRSEALPTATRVFLSIGGNAHRPNTFGTLNNPVDYTLKGMSVPFGLGLPFVDIPANKTSATVTLRPINDTIHEGTETASFTVLPNSAYDIGTPGSVTLTIADKDQVIFIARPTAKPVPTVTRLARSLFSDERIDDLAKI